MCGGHRGRCREDEAVECRVEHVAYGAGYDESQPYEYALGDVAAFAREVPHIIYQQPDEDYAEEAEGYLAPVEGAVGGYAHAEGGTAVLDEAQLEPVGDDDDRLAQTHVCLDPYFECLIEYEQHYDDY